jgi:hypothetical protein
MSVLPCEVSMVGFRTARALRRNVAGSGRWIVTAASSHRGSGGMMTRLMEATKPLAGYA